MIRLQDIDLEKMTTGELGELLVEAKKAYYTSGKPIMDDATYDTLEEILLKKNPYHRIFQKVGHKNFDSGFTKKKHQMPMGSQNKVNNYSDLVHYFELKKIPANTDFIIQPKCDGLSLEIEYREGRVVDAITRGDGETGDVITQNVIGMKNFLSNLSYQFTGSIRCEIVVTQKDFQKLNQIVGSDQYSNPRNAASGISQRLDGKYAEFCSLLTVDAYSQTQSYSSETEKINYLKKLGLETVETLLCPDLHQVENHYQSFLKEKRAKYDFDIDGLVVKIDNIKLQQTLGEKNQRPKGQVAYKFPGQTNTSRLNEIIWQTGPLGTVTPIAQIEPIEIAGAVVSFASLANHTLIEEKNINIGDIVEVSRRGDVIPYIEGIATKVNPGHLLPPKECPVCSSPLVIDNKYLRCPNSGTCKAQTLGALKLFCATLDIKGISDKTIEKLVTNGKVNLPGDFYDLQASDFIDLTGLGEKSGNNIVNQIQAKRNLTLKQVFDASIIPNFSKARIQQIIDGGYDTPQKIITLSVSDLLSLPGFQQTLATKIITGINQRLPFIKSILSKVEISKTSSNDGRLQGLSFAITGELSQPRKIIEKTIEDSGGKLVSSISTQTSFLITNQIDSGSSKLVAAKKLGIPIISEKELNMMISSS